MTGNARIDPKQNHLHVKLYNHNPLPIEAQLHKSIKQPQSKKKASKHLFTRMIRQHP